MSVLNSGQGFLSANIGPGAQYNNNAAGTQYNYNYYPGTSDIDRGPSKSEKEECLRSLIFSSLHARRHSIVVAYPNTGDWIFETPDFRQWRDRTHLSRHSGVLWIKGHPGSGKSTLMKHIWSHCQQELKDRTIAAYFFHARGDSLEKTPLGMLRSLVYQLLDKDEAIYQRFLPLFREKNRLVGKESDWREPELKDFLLSEMRVQQRKPIVLLVDALDECRESDVREVVRFFEELSLKYIHHKVDVSICLSSRHYPNISMPTSQNLVVEKMDGHRADIATYIQNSLAFRNRDIETGLLKKASGSFFWASLVVTMLNEAYDKGSTVEAMQRKLREVPKDLDELFSKILIEDNPDRQETMLMLLWVLLSVRMLTPEELYFGTLAGTNVKEIGPWDRSQETADNIERRIIHSSKGLIQIRQLSKYSRSVEFIHESVSDFLFGKGRLQSLDPTLGLRPIDEGHGRLTLSCIAYMEMIIAACKAEGTDVNDIRKSLKARYPFLLYATQHWWTHHCQGWEHPVGFVSKHKLQRELLDNHPDLPEMLFWVQPLFDWKREPNEMSCEGMPGHTVIRQHQVDMWGQEKPTTKKGWWLR